MCINLRSVRDNSFVLFWLKLYMIWTKGAYQSARFQTFDCSRKISPNLYFDKLLKVYKILAKKYRGVISHDPKNGKSLVKFDPSTRKSAKLALSFTPIVQSI